MNKVMHFLLKYSGIILEYRDSKGNKLHKMNLWNPLSYVALLITAALAFMAEGTKTAWKIVKETIKDSWSS